LDVRPADRSSRAARALEASDVKRLAPSLDVAHLERALPTPMPWPMMPRSLAIAATGFAHGGLCSPRRGSRADPRHRRQDRRRRAGGFRDRESTRPRSPRGERHRSRSTPPRSLRDRRQESARGALTSCSPERNFSWRPPSPFLSPGRRPVFLIPHPEGVLVGTTDIYHEEV
jgi:hypothetical protein